MSDSESSPRSSPRLSGMFRSMTRRSGSDSGRARARSLEDMRDLSAQPLPKPTKGALKQHPSAKGKGGSVDLKRSNARLLPLPSFGPGGIKGSVKRKIYRGIHGMALPKEFWEPNAFGVKGGIENGFMSSFCGRSCKIFVE